MFVYAVASAFKANRVNMMFGNDWKLDSALWVPAIPALKTQVTESNSMLLSVWSGELHCALLSAQWRHAPLFSTVHLKVNSGELHCLLLSAQWRYAPLFTWTVVLDLGRTGTGSGLKLNTLYRVRLSKEN
jgi:hypothetical protein